MSKFENSFELQLAVNQWCIGHTEDIIKKYGSIGDWNVSNVTNMNNMFYNATTFDSNINNWDVSNVTDMSNMFSKASNFNQPLNKWDVSNVEDMESMFHDATNFNQDIGNWDVSNVEDMNNMFHTATNFNQDIGNWDVSDVEDTSKMFINATNFNQDIGNWDVSNVKFMSYMFYNATVFNQPLNGWVVSNVEDMNNMFSKASNFNQPLNEWNVSNVEDMNNMFYDATNFNQDIGDWDVSKVVRMFSMFYSATEMNKTYSNLSDINKANWNEIFKRFNPNNKEELQKAINMWVDDIDAGRVKYGNISNWDVSKVTDMSRVFFKATNFDSNINNWDVSNVTDMGGMFYHASAFNQDIGTWDVSNVTNMVFMFQSATNFNQPLNGWDVSNVTNMIYMFTSATNFNQPLNGWDVSKVQDMEEMFLFATEMNKTYSNLSNINKPNWKKVFHNIDQQEQPDISIIPDILDLNPEEKKILLYSIQKILSNINEIDSNESINNIIHIKSGGFGHGFKIETNMDKKFFMKINKNIKSFETNKNEFKIISKLDHPNIIRQIIGIELIGNEVNYYQRNKQYISGFLKKTLEYNDINKPIFKNKFILITELYEGTIDNIEKDYWLNPINLIKFIMIILNVFHYFYSKGYSHKDIKLVNIAYYKEKGVVYFKVIDLGGLLKYNATFHKTNISYYNDNTNNKDISFYPYTPGFDSFEKNHSKIITDKYDIYSLGITIANLLYNYPTIITHKSINKILNSIFFKKKVSDTYDLSKISYMLKNLIELITQNNDYYKRPNTFVAMKYLVDIIYILPNNYITEIKDYLLENYKINTYNTQIENIKNISDFNYIFLPKIYQLIVYNFKNRQIKDICKIHLKRINAGNTDFSHNTLKYLTCNFLDFSDKMKNQSFLDPGHSVSHLIIIDNIFTKSKLLELTKDRNRETIKITEDNDVLVAIFNKFISDNELVLSNTDNSSKKILAYKLADHVFKIFNNNNIYKETNIGLKTSKSISSLKDQDNTVLLSTIAENKFGVCRHRAITFKYFCDLADIECRLIRGLLYSREKDKTDDIDDNRGIQSSYYHAWNILKFNEEKILVDIMNPLINSAGEKNYNNLGLVHKYAIPSLDVVIPLKETYLKQKINHYDLEI